MRPMNIVRAGVTAGALVAALLPAGASAQEAPLRVRVDDPTLRYGQAVVVTGRLEGAEQGRTVRLQFRPRGGGPWSSVADARTGQGGRFRLAAGLRASGQVRVVSAAASAASASAADGAQSSPRLVRVAAHVRTTTRRLDVRAGRTAVVRGVLRPRHGGRAVLLQRRSGRGWRTLDRARTAPGGSYRLSYRTRGSDSVAVRVRFPGDRGNLGTARGIGRLNAFRRSFASWYGPGLYGNRTACGQRLTPGIVGVAHKRLPCGTRVTLRHRSRIVRVRVIDRGPFHPGREFDLTAATKRRLGFGSTGTVWAAH